MIKQCSVVVFVVFSFGVMAHPVVETESQPLTTNSTQVVPSAEVAVSEAESWGLTSTEWDRHLQLKRGIRGSLSDSRISPIEVLGIHARSDDERARYAKMWATMMLEDAGRVLRFQRAYDEAIAELTESLPLIDPVRLQVAYEEPESPLKVDDRILFFASLDCAACEIVYDRIQPLIEEVAGIDIYFVEANGKDHARIREWASKREIEASEVRSRRISINLDNGLLKELRPHAQDVPHVLLRRGEQVLRFPTSSIP